MLNHERFQEEMARDRARAAAHYSGLMRRLIHDLKFHDRDDLAVLLGGWLTEAGREFWDGADLIVPVPLSRMRLIRRRYEEGGLGALLEERRGGTPPVVDGKLEKRLCEMFEQGLSIRRAHKLIKGRVSEATVGRVRGRWGRQRAAQAEAEGTVSEARPAHARSAGSSRSRAASKAISARRSR